MPVDVTKLNFYSGYPIDKVVNTGTIAVVNSGATSNAPQTAFLVTSTIPNPYGRRCFVRARWSIDGGSSWQSLDSQLLYTFTITAPGPTVTTLSGLKGAISVGASDSTLYFRTANGLHGNVTDNGVTYTYTPTSQTFTIQYALFEIE